MPLRIVRLGTPRHADEGLRLGTVRRPPRGVPKSEFAFAMRSQQMRYLAIQPKRADTIESIEFVKGEDRSAPLVLAVTVETLAERAP